MAIQSSPLKNVLAKPEHEVLYQDLAALLSKHAGKMTATEILAVAANMVGKLVAMQDQRRYTVDQIMALVGSNIELGNQQVRKQLETTQGSA